MPTAACDMAEPRAAKPIGVPRFWARTGPAAARLRPRLPIIGLSHRQSSVQQLALEWGVTPLPFPEAANVEDLWDRAVEAVRREGLVKSGDLVVLTAGTAVNMPGSTNMTKVGIAQRR